MTKNILQKGKEFLLPLTTPYKYEMTIISIIYTIIFFCFWSGLTNTLIPSPIAVLTSLKNYLSNEHFYDCLLNSLFLTTQATLFSLLFSLLVSYLYFFRWFKPISFLSTKFRFLSYSGLINIFYMVFTDIGELKVFLLMFGIIPFFSTSLISSFMSINPQLYDLCTTLRLNKLETFYEVVIQGQKSSVLESLRQNFAISWMMITMIEALSMSQAGLGSELVKQAKYIHLDNVLAIITIIFSIGILLDLLFLTLSKTLYPYKK
jgi:NitT/TauT family transport system permease protein